MIKDVKPVQDEYDKNLFFISGSKGFGLDRNYIVGPNENLLERYKQMVEHCNEIGLYPAYGNTSPAMNPDREYAIEMDGETFKIIRKDSDISPFKGDKIIIPGDNEEYFCDISTSEAAEYHAHAGFAPMDVVLCCFAYRLFSFSWRRDREPI